MLFIVCQHQLVGIAKGEVESELLNTYRGSQKFQSGMKLKSYGIAIHYLNDAEVYYVIIIHAGHYIIIYYIIQS